MESVYPIDIPTGLINRIKNGEMKYCPEGTETGADGSTCFGSYTRLSQSASIQTSQLTAPEDGQSRAMRITQPSATAQRVGVSQAVLSIDACDLRESPVAITFHGRYSVAGRLMYALLQWTGTADAAPADPINDWTSTSYIPGSFFKSTFEVVGYGYLSVPSAEWHQAPYIPLQPSDDMNNLILVVWTENTLAQNGTVDVGQVTLIQGATPLAFEHRPYALEQAVEAGAIVAGTYAAVRLLPADAAPAVIVLGRTEANDGGGGIFYWLAGSSTADNDGTILAPSSGATGRWIRQYTSVVNVAWWGTPSSDDTSKFVAAMAATPDGGEIQIPVTTDPYIITQISPAKNLLFTGTGRYCWIRHKASTSTDMISVTTDAITVEFNNIRLDGNSSNQSATTSAAIIRCTGNGVSTVPAVLVCENVIFENPPEQAIAYYGDNVNATAELCIVRDCIFRGGTQGSEIPVYKPVYILIADAPYVTVEDNDFDFGSSPSLGRGVLWVLSTDSSTPKYGVMTITGNRGRRVGTTQSGAPGCIDLYLWSKYSRVCNNSLEDCNGFGFRVKTNSLQCIFDGNAVNGITNGATAMMLATANFGTAQDQIQITNNQIVGGVGAPAMAITCVDASSNYSKGVRVAGNQIKGHSAEGILVQSAKEFMLESNEVIGGTIAFSIQGAIGLNSIVGNRSFGSTGAYGLYIDTSTTADFLIANHAADTSGSSAAIYVAARDVVISDFLINDGTGGIIVGACASLTINGGKAVGGSGIAVNVTGNISGDLRVNNVSTDAATPYAVSGTITGQNTNDMNSWNYASAAPAWSAPIGTKVWNTTPAPADPMGWMRSTGPAWKAMAAIAA